MPFDLPFIKKPAALLLALVVLGAGGLAATDSHAAKRAKHGAHRVKFEKSGSAESVRDRDRRLARECRGQPNAGACLGFGQ